MIELLFQQLLNSVKLKEFPSLASDQPRSRLAPSSYSALSLLLRDLQVESGNESMDGERIFGKASNNAIFHR